VATRPDIAALLSAHALSRLRAACGLDAPIHVAETIEELETIVRQRAIAVAVVDPMAVCDMSERVRRLARGVPVVAYADVTALAVRAVLKLGVRHVILQGHDDSPLRLRNVLTSAMVAGPVADLLARLAPTLDRVPMPVRTAIAVCFYSPRRVPNARALALLIAMPPRTLSRCCERAGLCSARRLTVAAHVFRAYHLLRATNDRISDVGERVGCDVTKATREVTGRLPRDLARRVAPEAMTDIVLRYLTTRRPAPEAHYSAGL